MNRTPRASAKLADNQLVANKREVIKNVFLLELFRAVRIIVVGEVANHDIRIGDQWLQESDLRKASHRQRIIRRRAVHESLHRVVIGGILSMIPVR